MTILEVKDRLSEGQFLECARAIQQGDPEWVCPLDGEISGIFDPRSNDLFTHGEAARWILVDDQGQLAGRIAAFINYAKTKAQEVPIGGLGFFECIDHEEAAAMLFGKAEAWLQARGMKGAEGPINFGENDSHWGLLVEGFSNPAFGMAYNPPYYRRLFETNGYVPYYEQISSEITLGEPFPERFWKIAAWVAKKPEYEFKSFKFREKEKFVADFVEVYNEAWQFHDGFRPMETGPLLRTLEKAKDIIDEGLIHYAYHGKEPIGFLVIYPDLNPAIKPLRGQLTFWNKIRFFLFLKKRITRARVVIIGVKPRYQQSGIESAMLFELKKAFEARPRYTHVEISWVGDFNPKMRALQEATGARPTKKHITYRKWFGGKPDTAGPKSIPTNSRELLRQSKGNGNSATPQNHGKQN